MFSDVPLIGGDCDARGDDFAFGFGAIFSYYLGWVALNTSLFGLYDCYLMRLMFSSRL